MVPTFLTLSQRQTTGIQAIAAIGLGESLRKIAVIFKCHLKLWARASNVLRCSTSTCLSATGWSQSVQAKLK